MPVVPEYRMHPGCCIRCNDVKKPVYDLERDFPDQRFEGRIYLCMACVADMYSELLAFDKGRGGPGLVRREYLDEAIARAVAAEKRVADLSAFVTESMPSFLERLGEIVPLVRPPETAPPAEVPTPAQPAQPEPSKRRGRPAA